MKIYKGVFTAALLSAVLLAGCGEKPQDAPVVNVETTTTTVATTTETPTTVVTTTEAPTTTTKKKATTTKKKTTTTKKKTTTTKKVTTTTKKVTTTTSKPTTTKKVTTTQNIEDNQEINVSYQKINYDNKGYRNSAEIVKIDINKDKMFITFKILEHNGDGYDNFATDAVFYDANDNIIDVRQVMYATNIGTAIGNNYVDDFYIPEGTKNVLINSGTKNIEYKVSKNHGTSNVKFDIPEICYDDNGYGNAVEVKSYNVHENKMFLTYAAKNYYGGGYNSFATQMVFYNMSGSIIDTRQVMYVGQLDASSIGMVYFDDFYLPEGTARVEVKENKPNPATTTTTTLAATTTTTSTLAATTTTKDNTKWSYSEAKQLDTYIEYAESQLKTATQNSNKGGAYLGVAINSVGFADDWIEKAIALIESKSDITMTNGSSLFAMCKEAHEILSQFDDVTVTMDYINENKNDIVDTCLDGQLKVSLIRIVTSKLLLEFY